MSKPTPSTQEKVDARRQEVRQAVKNACNMLNADGVDARNYVEQTRPRPEQDAESLAREERAA